MRLKCDIPSHPAPSHPHSRSLLHFLTNTFFDHPSGKRTKSPIGGTAKSAGRGQNHETEPTVPSPSRSCFYPAATAESKRSGSKNEIPTSSTLPQIVKHSSEGTRLSPRRSRGTEGVPARLTVIVAESATVAKLSLQVLFHFRQFVQTSRSQQINRRFCNARQRLKDSNPANRFSLFDPFFSTFFSTFF